MFIFPDEVLNELICSNCSKYLSMKPIKVYGRGIIKCGRCSRDSDDGVVSLYNNIIANGLFPCINRYDGCNQLLNCSEVAAHEKVCISRTYKCSISSSENECTAYQLLQHYQNTHANQVLEKPEIVTNGEKEFENYYMYKENNFIFIIYLRCNVSEKCFFLNVACLGSKDRLERILQYVKCYLNDNKDSKRLFFQTKKRRCSIFENNADSFKISFPNKMNLVTLNFCLDKSGVENFNYITFNNNSITNTETYPVTNKTEIVGLHNQYPKIYLSAEYKQEYPNHYLSPCGTKVLIPGHNKMNIFPRICEFCENIFPISKSTTLFKCACNHIYCSTCYAIEPCCCKTKVSELKYAVFETSVYRLLYFYCRWNCERFYCGADLRYHEDHCKENDDAQDTLSDLVTKHFNFYLSTAKSHLVSRSNIFSFSQYNFENKPKVFVITRDYFKFVLHSSYEDKMLHFWVSHDYPSEKYYIFFRIRDKLYKNDYFRVNTFSIDNSQGNILGFAVLLREKQ